MTYRAVLVAYFKSRGVHKEGIVIREGSQIVLAISGELLFLFGLV